MKQTELSLESPSGKTCQEPYDQTTETISELFSTPWQTAGRWTLNGESSMHSSSESPPAAAASFSSLSTILQPNTEIQPKYFLSNRSIAGIYDRIKTQLSGSTEHTDDTTNHNEESHQPSKQSRRSVLRHLVIHLEHSLQQNTNDSWDGPTTTPSTEQTEKPTATQPATKCAATE